MHVIGASGTGKSTLLLQLITQDIEQGNGVAVLDPHGDLIDDVLARIPSERIQDVVLFDPSDEAWPVGLNVLAATTILEKQLLSSDLVSIFRRLSTSWGDTMDAVLSNAVLAMLESDVGGTLVDLRRFLLDEGFRKHFLESVSDEEVQFFWAKGFPLVGTRSIGPIITRLDAFLRPKLIRHIVGQRTPRVNVNEVVTGGKIFLAKLSQGLIGEENSHLLGSLLAMRFHQVALSRQAVRRGARRPFFFSADEAQHFVTPSMASLLTDVRKYGLGLVLSHQNLFQLRGSPVESALLGNAHMRIAFRVGSDDAKKLAEGLSFFEARDLVSLGRGEAVARFGLADHDCSLRTLPLAEIDIDVAEPRRAAVIEASRSRFGVPIEDVRAHLTSAYSSPQPKEASSAPKPVSPNVGVLHHPSPPPSPSNPEREARPATPVARKATSPVHPLPDLGRGGQQHKYLQHLIKRLGEERGFRVVIEQPVADGQIDVVLKRDEDAIAIEISISTSAAHETGNAEKCVRAGYLHVAMVCPDGRQRQRLSKTFAGIPSLVPVRVLDPIEVADYLDEFQTVEPTEAVVRGYKVRITRQTFSPDVSARRAQVAAVIARSLRKPDQ
jgi:hypothetical protein